MKRTRVITWGLALVTAVGCLAVGKARGTRHPEPPEGNGWRVAEPVTYENLSIFPVVSRPGSDTSGFVTLDEALASGDAIVTERGSDVMRRTRDGVRPDGRGRPAPQIYPSDGASVNQLVLINRGKKPLVLLAGELVSGGKQDRIIAKDRIIAPGAPPLPLDVFCVEHGRWSSGAQFTAAKVIVHPSVREKAAVDQKQSGVWAAVRSGTTAKAPSGAPNRITEAQVGALIGAVAQTESYDKIYNSSHIGVPVNTFSEEIERRFARATANLKGERVVGVVVAYGGETAWSDIFASAGLFERYWPKLLKSYVVEALARPQSRERASQEDARAFLRPLEGRENAESEPGIYRWRQVSEGQYTEIELEALKPMEITLHRLKIHRTS